MILAVSFYGKWTVRSAHFLFNKACDIGNREGCMLAGRNRVGSAY